MNTALPADNVTQISKPTVSHVAVTPEVAHRWLRHNRTNRRLDWHTVEKYARTMKAGNWSLDSNAICFDTEGNLLNGQHRLSAVRLAGATITFVVQRNVPPQAMKYMDRGRGRTTAQNLSFEGEKHASLLASTLRLMVTLTEDVAYSRASDDMIYQYLQDNPSIRQSVAIAGTAKADIDAPPTSVGTAHWIISGNAPSEQVSQYFDALRTRAGEPAGSAVLAVDKRLREIRKHGQKYQALDFAHLFIKGWNYWAAGRSVAKLQMPRPGSPLPEVGRWTR